MSDEAPDITDEELRLWRVAATERLGMPSYVAHIVLRLLDALEETEAELDACIRREIAQRSRELDAAEAEWRASHGDDTP